LANVFTGFADIKLVRNGIANLSLRDHRLVLSVGRHEQTTLLKNAAGAITRDGPVIHERNSAAICQHANGFGGHCGAEGSAWNCGNQDTYEPLLHAAIVRTRLLSARLGATGLW
jgi:hypothetical protein